MSTVDLLAAFNQSGKGKASAVRMRYDHAAGPNMQVLEIDGHLDGNSFSVVSQPFAGDPAEMARNLAKEEPAANPPADPTERP